MRKMWVIESGSMPACRMQVMPPLGQARWWAGRDPLAGEQGKVVREAFAGQAPDVRVALDLSRDGGFLLEFRGEGNWNIEHRTPNNELRRYW